MQTIRLLFITILNLALLSSCVDESYEDCPSDLQSGVNLKYDYLLNMDYKNLFQQQVADLKAFIFDDKGILCDTLTPAVVNNQLTNDWSRAIKLAPGTYSIVTWGGNGHFERSFKFAHENRPSDLTAEGVVIGQTKIEDLRTFLRYDLDPENLNEATPRTDDFNELFYGIQKNIVVTSKEYTTVNTSLIKDSKTVRVKVNKLSNISNSTFADSDFAILLTGRNGHYKADNQTNEANHLIRYTPYLSEIKEDALQADIKTLRLRRFEAENPFSAPMLLTVVYKPKNMTVCKNLDIVDLLLNSKIPARDSEGKIQTDANGETIWIGVTTEYLDRQDLFEFAFEKENGNIDFTVLVNGWKIVNIVPDNTH